MTTIMKELGRVLLSEGIDYPGERYLANNGKNEYVQLKKHKYSSATMWQTCSQVCTDGKGTIKSPTHQSTTAMGPNINAEIHPYIVLPTGNKNNVMIGDLGVVIDTTTGKSAHVIFAERGPKGVIGEMSIAVFNKLGLGYRNSNGTFYGYPEKRFITIMFPGSGARYGYGYNKVPKSAQEVETNGFDAFQDFMYDREHREN